VSNHEAENKILVVIGVCDNQIGSKIEAYAIRQRILKVYAVHGSLPSLGRAEHFGFQKKREAHKGGHILIGRSIPTFGGNQCLWVMCSGKYLKVSRSVGLADGSRI
jgi:hypothetical protein